MPRVAPPGTENQDVGIRDIDAQVDDEVAQQADAVGVVAKDLAVLKRQRIDRAGGAGAFAELVNEPADRALVRHGDVEALAAGALKLAHGFFKFFGCDAQQLVLEGLACLQRKQSVDNGRPAV